MSTIHMKRFTEVVHKEQKCTKLDDSFMSIETPIGLRLSLLPHQALIVNTILDIEHKPMILVGEKMKTKCRIQTSAIVLSEPFGSGKTIELLAVVLHNPIPLAHSQYKKVGHSGMTVYRQYTKLIKSTLVVVSSSVLQQWRKTILEHTVLSVMVIDNYYDFVKLMNNTTTLEDSLADIVLLKNGVISCSKMGINENRKASPDLLYDITYGYCWARVIYDDYDVIKLHGETRIFEALSTIYVSSTNKSFRVKYDDSTKSDFIKITEPSMKISNIQLDQHLMTNFRISCDRSYREQSLSVPKINYYKYLLYHKDDNYIKMIGSMFADNADVVEMLNSNAIKTVALTLNMNVKSISNIFERILDKQYTLYIREQKLIKIISTSLEEYSSLPYIELNSDEIKAIVVKLKGGHVPRLTGRSIKLISTIEELLVDCVATKDKLGSAISRVIDNIKQGECQICYESMEEANIFINKCCGLILCDRCGVRANKLKGSKGSIEGLCPQCRHQMTVNDLLFVDKDINLDVLMTAIGDENDTFDMMAKDDVSVEKNKNPSKIDMIFEIINSTSNLDSNLDSKLEKQRLAFDKQVANLMNGTYVYAHKDTDKNNNKKVQKICIFSGYNETIEQIESALVEKGVSFLRLEGTSSKLANLIDEFRKTIV